MKVKLIKKTFVYEIDKNLIDELRKRGFCYIVKWKDYKSNGLEWWYYNNSRTEVSERKILQEVCKILHFDIKHALKIKFNMGVCETDDGEGYRQFLKNIELITDCEIKEEKS